MTCIDVVAAAVGLLLGADEKKGSDSKKDEESQAPADSGFITGPWPAPPGSNMPPYSGLGCKGPE